jgi:hypothetical protein
VVSAVFGVTSTGRGALYSDLVSFRNLRLFLSFAAQIFSPKLIVYPTCGGVKKKPISSQK